MHKNYRLLGVILLTFTLVLGGGAACNNNQAILNGIIQGTATDGTTPLDGVTVVTAPATSTATTDASGAFALSDVPIGAYSVTAAKSGYTSSTLQVGVAAGGTTQVSFTLVPAPPSGPGTISGTVQNAIGDGIAGVVVTAEGQPPTATTDASGNFTLTGVDPGFVYLYAAVPSGSSYLDGETRESLFLNAAGTVSGVTINLSSRPMDTATYVGGATCSGCHAEQWSELTGAGGGLAAAHNRSITPDKTRMVDTGVATIWPGVGGTVASGFTAKNPAGGADVLVFLCQNTAGAYAMKFGGTADCTVVDGTLVPVSGTYGGEGDGGVDAVPNLGKFKQRFLAKLADIPVAGPWPYTSGKDKDYLILPVQITQSGDGSPKLGKYHETDWTGQKRTFSRACAGCHNTGMEITDDGSADHLITSYNYADLNITCERCHGPGSEHVSASLGQKALHIIIPTFLTAEAERQVCGQCHAADDGKSLSPSGSFGYAYNDQNASLLGGGIYVPGVYDLVDYIKGFGVTEENGGGFNAWPDGIHGKAHRQQFPELAQAVHTNNSEEKITCASCHDPHTTQQGNELEEESGTDEFVFDTPTFKNNVLCLGCHAEMGPYAGLSKSDVAAIHVDAGGSVTINGAPYAPTAAEIAQAKLNVATAVSNHMQEEVGMGNAAYNPLDDLVPVGRCQSCHMPKTGKSGGYTTGLDASGDSALIEGDQGSHAFDIIWPSQSAALKKLTGGVDTDIMPNSCGKCHDGARLSGN